MKNNEWMDIGKKIEALLMEQFYIPKEKLGIENWDIALTSEFFGFMGIDLVYLLFEIEKQYHVRIPEEYLGNYKFNSIRGVTDALYEVLSSK